MQTQPCSNFPTVNDFGPTLLRRNIRCSYFEAALFNFMVGIGETYLAAFLLAGGANPIHAGLIASLPLLTGSACQVLLQKKSVQVKSRIWVCRCAFLQASLFIPLSLMAFLNWTSFVLVFLLASLYWATGMSAMQIWNFWIDSLIPSDRRPMFLAVRSRISQISIFAGFLSGGLLLQLGKNLNAVMPAFASVFLLAAISRFISLHFLSRQSDSPKDGIPRLIYSFREVRNRFKGTAISQYFRFLLLMHGAVFLAAPFFTPYMLGELDLSYSQYMFLIAIAYVAKALVFPSIGKYCVMLGARRMVLITGLSIAPLSSLWYFSQNITYLAVIQVLAGIAWAGYELSALLLIFEEVRIDERSSVLSYYNFFQSFMVALGSLGGAMMLGNMNPGIRAFWTVFIVSSVLRVFCTTLLLNVSNISVRFRPIRFRSIAIRPFHGSIDKPFILDDEEVKE